MYIWLPSLKIFVLYNIYKAHTQCVWVRDGKWVSRMVEPNWTVARVGAHAPGTHFCPLRTASLTLCNHFYSRLGFPRVFLLKKGKIEIISLFDRLLTSYFFCPGLEKKKTLFLFIYSVFFFFFCRFLCFKLCQRGFCWLHFQSERKNVQPLTLSIFTRGYYISTSFFFLRSSAVILNCNH